MSIQPGKFASARSTLWNRVRLQLGLGLLIAVIAPWAVRVRFAAREFDMASLQNSLIGTTIALIAGYYGYRRLSRYPGVRASYHILPSFAAAYGIVLAFFFFFRLDYSRLHFLASFGLCVVWYYIVYFKLQRQQRLRIGVVPAGEVDMLYAIPDVDWVRLQGGQLDPDGFDVIVADLRADLSDEWERFLADRALNGTLVMHVKQMEESLTGRVAIEHLSENNLGSLIPGIVFGKIKRLADLGSAALAMPLMAPFLLLVGLAIRLDSRGPGLVRAGADGLSRRAVPDVQVPDDDRRRRAGGCAAGGDDPGRRPSRHPARQVPAQISRRRAAAGDQHLQGRDELDRAAPRGGAAIALVPGRAALLPLPPHRAARASPAGRRSSRAMSRTSTRCSASSTTTSTTSRISRSGSIC